MPYGCLLGSGRFSVLLEQQLLLLGTRLVQTTGSRQSSQETPQETPIESNNDHDSLMGKPHGRPRHGEGGDLPQVRQKRMADDTNQNEGYITDLQPMMPSAQPRSELRDDECANTTPTPAATTPIGPVCSRWESLVLGATRLIMNADQLDQAALWALERALLPLESSHDDVEDRQHLHRESLPDSGNEHFGTVTLTSQRSTQQAATGTVARETSDRNSDSNGEQLQYWKNGQTSSHETATLGAVSSTAYAVEHEGGKTRNGAKAPSTTAASTLEAEQVASRATGHREIDQRDSYTLKGTSNFCLEVVWSEEDEVEEAGVGNGEDPQGKSLPPRLCGDLVRWGWRMAKLGLAHVIVRYVVAR